MSRSVNAEYWQRQCSLYFPEVNGFTFGSAEGKDAEEVNWWTKGWHLTDTTRLIWANGYESHLHAPYIYLIQNHANQSTGNTTPGSRPVFPPISDLEDPLSRPSPPR